MIVTATEAILHTMSSTLTSPTQATPATTQSTPTPAPATAGTNTRMSNAYNATFGMPLGIHLPQFDGSEWNHWSETLEVILTVSGCVGWVKCDSASRLS
jgi:hypothetical protein